MKSIYKALFLLTIINSNAQTYDVYLTGNWEDQSFFEIYNEEDILITTDNNDTIFSGFLKFESTTAGSVTIKAEEGYQVKITPTKSNNRKNTLGTGTQIGGGLGGGGLTKIEIFPNPAYNLIQLQSTKNIIVYKIYDSQGVLKLENRFLKSKQFSVNINNLNPGIYHATISLENGQIISKQFIKQ